MNRSSSLLDGRVVYECCVYTHKDVILRRVGNTWEPQLWCFSLLPFLSRAVPAQHGLLLVAELAAASPCCFFHGSCGRFLPFSLLFTVIWLRVDWFCLFPFAIWKDALTVKLDYT